MFYNSSDVEETLKCSFCRVKFEGVIKLIPECGESICGDCYEELKDCVEFKCESDTCRETHSMPKTGLPDNKGLQRLLEKQKMEKPLSEKAKELRVLVDSIKNQLQELKSFDAGDCINQHCDRLEIEVVEEIASVMKELNKIQEDLLQKINNYREDSLNSLSSTRSNLTYSSELDLLSSNVSTFSGKWGDYFSRVEVLASDTDIQAALEEAREYDSKMESLKSQLTRASFSGKLMEFRADHDLLKQTLEPLFSLVTNHSIEDNEYAVIPIRKLTGHSDCVYQAIFTKDHQLVSCSMDNTIKVWDVVSGRMLFELRGHAHSVCSLCLLENGWLASGSSDNTVIVWDLNSRKLVRQLIGHSDWVVALKTLKNGNLASYSLDNTIRIWDPYSTGIHLILTISGHGNTTWVGSFVDVLPDDSLVTCSRDNATTPASKDLTSVLRIWNMRNGKCFQQIPTGSAKASTMSVLLCYQAAVGFENGSIKLFDLAVLQTDRLMGTINKAHSGVVSFILQLSSGNLVTSGLDETARTIKVWRLKDLSLLCAISASNQNGFDYLSISPDEELLANVSCGNTIALWSIVAD